MLETHIDVLKYKHCFTVHKAVHMNTAISKQLKCSTKRDLGQVCCALLAVPISKHAHTYKCNYINL